MDWTTIDWNSSALWGIIGLIGGFIVSFIFYKISNKSKKIVYTKNSQVLITDNLSNINDLNITYQNKPIKNLTSTTVTIKSIGKDIIEMNDFGQATPMCIKTDGEFLLQSNIDSVMTNNSNPNNLMQPHLKDNVTLLLEFDYLSQGDTITFTLFHTEKISVEGKLKAGSFIDNNLSKRINTIMDTIFYITCSILVFMIMVVYVVFSGVNEMFINIGNFLINLLLGALLINYFKKIFTKLNNSVEINVNESENTHIQF